MIDFITWMKHFNTWMGNENKKISRKLIKRKYARQALNTKVFNYTNMVLCTNASNFISFFTEEERELIRKNYNLSLQNSLNEYPFSEEFTSKIRKYIYIFRIHKKEIEKKRRKKQRRRERKEQQND